MRKGRLCVPMIVLCLLLAACGGEGGGSEAEELALVIRGEYLAMTGCTAHMEVTADYGQRVYTYGIDLNWQREGESTLTLTSPENVAGTTVRIQAGETWLDFDGVRVETGTLADSGLTPVGAAHTLLTCAREGFLAECTLETLDENRSLHVTSRDPEAGAGEGVETQLWFDAATHALLRGEISSDGFTVLQCELTDFQMMFAESPSPAP